jgi:hypothetical protein
LKWLFINDFYSYWGAEMNLVQGTNTGHGRLVLLAPADAFIPEGFAGVEYNPQYHAIVLAGLQRLRGQAYFEDGAIDRTELEPDGRYVQPADERAWHLVTLNGSGDVCGCARYLAHSRWLRFSDTGVANSPLSTSPEWASSFRRAVESEIERAYKLGVDYVEVGGWALKQEIRCTSEALRIALGMFSMARLLGGSIGLTTATVRHCSSSILRRIGGQPLMTNGIEIPRYFDARYGCQMEVLRFDSAKPNARFEPWIEELKRHLSAIPVIRGGFRSDLYDRHACSSEMTAA